jgi:DNA adenine methylase
MVKPFIKWVGGKRQLLPELRARIPSTFGTYHEPFLGGGALFFDLLPKCAFLSDTNERLVRTYRAIRDGVEHVIALLKSYEHSREKFDELRACDVDALDDTHVAAWFVYLNKTCFNGLYRVNSENVFNVPFDDTRQRATRICDDDNLRACSDALRGVQIRHAHFAECLADVEPGDLVYFDPPYVPLSASSSFTAYTAEGFDLSEQIKLRDVARELKRRGAHVLLSNSSAPLVSTLYGKDFEIEHVNAGRSINSDGAKRGRIAESIVR